MFFIILLVIFSNKLETISAPRLPIIVSFTAINPFPLNKYLCPGNTPSAVADSGAPRNMLGMTSKNVWVVAIAMMKQAINILLMFAAIPPARLTAIVLMRLTCIPGVNPVIIPEITPRIIAIIISRSISFMVFLVIYFFQCFFLESFSENCFSAFLF